MTRKGLYFDDVVDNLLVGVVALLLGDAVYSRVYMLIHLPSVLLLGLVSLQFGLASLVLWLASLLVWVGNDRFPTLIRRWQIGDMGDFSIATLA